MQSSQSNERLITERPWLTRLGSSVRLCLALLKARGMPPSVVIAGLLGVVVGVSLLILASCQSGPPRLEVGVGSGRVHLTGEPNMRIRVLASVDRARLSGATRMRVTHGHGDARELAGPLELRAGGSGVDFVKGSERVFHLDPGESADLDPLDGERLLVNGATYPGVLRVVARPGTKSGGGGGGGGSAGATIDVIELLPIETYLAGVLPRELFPDWPLEAYRVQAICARTYALHERDRSLGIGEDYDVEASTQDQAYGPTLKHATAAKALEDTRGVVLTWEDRLLRAYYSSTCGGRPASARDVWRTDAGYEFNLAGPIQGRPREHACQPATYYTWNVERDAAALSAQIRRWAESQASSPNGVHPARAIKVLRSVKVSARNLADRPSAYELLDDSGKSFTLSAEELRLACNTEVPGQTKVDGKTRVRSGDVDVTVRGNTVKITGRGFGHGVGMCQWCTKVFADQGVDWRTMLGWFYPGAKLERAYE